MMTGPACPRAEQHFLEAVRLIAAGNRDCLDPAPFVAEAQVHATLALAAATIEMAAVTLEVHA